VRRHGERDRKCGPGHALTVARCRVHELAFTLYPLGWTPYGRVPLIAVSPDAALLSSALEVAASPSLSATPGHRRTRVRAIRIAALWLGLSGDRHGAVAAALDFDLAAHEARRSAYARAPTWHRRAQIVTEAHGAMSPDRRLERLLMAGFRAGCIGRPWGVDSVTGALVPLVSSSESAASRGPPAPSAASTTWPTFAPGEDWVGGSGG
jgi:hypothetical protein